MRNLDPFCMISGIHRYILQNKSGVIVEQKRDEEDCDIRL